jgi:hypothetical protein
MEIGRSPRRCLSCRSSARHISESVDGGNRDAPPNRRRRRRIAPTRYTFFDMLTAIRGTITVAGLTMRHGSQDQGLFLHCNRHTFLGRLVIKGGGPPQGCRIDGTQKDPDDPSQRAPCAATQSRGWGSFCVCFRASAGIKEAEKADIKLLQTIGYEMWPRSSGG